MKKHVDLVGVLYRLWGGVVLVLSLSLLSIGFAAAAIGSSAPHETPGGRVAAGIVAAGFFALSAVGFVFGLVHIWIGTRVRRLREWARAAAIVLAVVNIVVPPFGTALGAYALWALLAGDSKALFHASAAQEAEPSQPFR